MAEAEAAGASLPWAAERRWRRETHLGWRDGVLILDLHDLDARTTRALAHALLETPPPGGGVVLVHGVGRRSGARGPVLIHVLREVLGGTGRLRTLSPGRTAWIVDDSAPGWLRGEWGCATRALFFLLAALAALGLWGAFWGR